MAEMRTRPARCVRLDSSGEVYRLGQRRGANMRTAGAPSPAALSRAVQLVAAADPDVRSDGWRYLSGVLAGLAVQP